MQLHDALTAKASAKADILVLTSSFPRFPGDLSAPYLLELCRHLQNGCKNSIQVLFPSDNASCVSSQDTGGLECHRFDYLPVRKWQSLAFGAGIPDNLMRAPWIFFQIPFFLNGFYRRAEQLAANADVLHCHWIFPAGWIGARLKRKFPSLKLVISIHSSDLELLEKIPFGKKLFRSIANAADYVTVVHSGQITKVERIMGAEFAKTKLSVVPMGIERAPRTVSKHFENSFKILFMGRLVPIKGLRYLLEACEEIENAEVLIAGDGPEKETLSKRFTRAKFLGSVSGDEKKKLLDSANLAVFPSIREIWRTEGAPVSLLECMAAGVPVIASKTGGMEAIIRHGQNGILVQEKNVLQLRAAILNLQNNSDLRRELANRAFLDTEDYEWNRIAARFHAIYGDALNARRDWIA